MDAKPGHPPPLPYEITEGRKVAALVNQDDVDFGTIAYWCAWDSTGRHFQLSVAPWHKRWLSQWRRKHAKAAEEGDGG